MIHSTLLSALPQFDHGFGDRRLSEAQDGMASLKQIHSAHCIRTSEPGRAGEGDALITNRAGLAVSVRTADCLPILLADSGTGAVAAVHAGWRGTVARIVAATVSTMRVQFSTQPGDLYAAIGPGIGLCCYEVGEDVARKFGLDHAGRVDLAAANRAQLIECGVAESRIEIAGLCTFCDAERFHSFRRDKEQAGRMVSFIKRLS
jgi:YfiH family protein